MRVLYFAWVKEKVGIAAEDIDPPKSVTTIAELIDWLKARGPEFAWPRTGINPTEIRPGACGVSAARRRSWICGQEPLLAINCLNAATGIR